MRSPPVLLLSLCACGPQVPVDPPGLAVVKVGASSNLGEANLEPDLLQPHEYGLSGWQALDQRTRRNLASQILDEARIHVAEGEPDPAREDVGQALEITLHLGMPATFHRPGDPERAGPAPDPRPLEERIRVNLAAGWFDDSVLAWASLFPGQSPDPLLAYGGQDWTLASGVRHLLVARRAAARGDDAGARAAASKSIRELAGDMRVLLDEARDQPESLGKTLPTTWLAGDPFQTTSPWGWSSTDFVLERFVGYLEEARGLAGLPEDPSTTALRDEATRWVADSRARVGAWPSWTQARALGRAPT